MNLRDIDNVDQTIVVQFSGDDIVVQTYPHIDKPEAKERLQQVLAGLERPRLVRVK